MNPPLYYLSLAGMVLLSLACGKNPAGAQAPMAAAETTLSSEIEAYAQSSGGRSAIGASAGADYGGGVKGTALRILDAIYGPNPLVTRVAVGAAGLQMGQPNSSGNFPAAAKGAIFDKDASGKFQLSSGDPTQIGSIPYNALYLFLASGIIPVAAGGSGFCAGIPGKAAQSGVFALGLGFSSSSGAVVGFAGMAVRTGNQYRACSLAGCTNVATVPYQLANPFPLCDRLLK